MRSLIRLFDRFLRWVQGVYVFWDDPICMFRARIAQAPHTLYLPDGEVRAGATVLELHFWNEHMPRIPPEGPNLSVAVQGRRMLVTSLRQAAHHIQDDRPMTGVQAVGGATVLFAVGDGSGAEKLFTRLGFSEFPYQSPLGRFGEFWENLYTWGLMWAFNEVSLRQRHLLKLRRTEIWMSVDEFLRKYGASEAKERPRVSGKL
jgi:hypothetical protein